MKYTERMHIVRASPQHSTIAVQLLDEYYEAIGVIVTDEPADINVYLASTDAAMWIAFTEDAAAGCVILRPLPTVQNAGECKRLYVRPACRGRHIADALMDTLEAHARTLGISAIYLDSKDDLRDAIRLYERRGYQHIDRYNDNPQATVFMRKTLHPQRQSESPTPHDLS